MEPPQDDDIIRIKQLLHHTGEFIAYFERVDMSLMEWRAEIEQHSYLLQEYAKNLQNQLAYTQNLLSQSGVAQSEATTQQLQEKIEIMTQNGLEKIDYYMIKATEAIATQLSRYDVHEFHRIASESCDYVAETANDAMAKSKKLLKRFHLKNTVLALFATIITAFIIALYLSGEFPWEMHDHAVNERYAGKMLLQAWPKLSQEEKNKILT